ncbi:hypothetical protein KFK09_008714 [Dendrobium nobile]|uniref:Uncharacterized protein n=1 Tax=Dendrobium nobile TaxID=94219 RepID=A0A8T3BPS4_DENNO|nr:hypothetical protein KFK09_008714 [Dendrobium nobile]
MYWPFVWFFHRISASVLISANVVVSSSAPMTDNVASKRPIFPIKALVVNEDNCNHLVNDIDVANDVGLTDGGVVPSRISLPMALSCYIGEGINLMLDPNNFLENYISSMASNSIDDNGQNVVVVLNSTPLGLDVVYPVSSLERSFETLNVGVPYDDLDHKSVEISIGTIHDKTVVRDIVNPSVNLSPIAFVDIPILVVPNEEMKVHLVSLLINSNLDQFDGFWVSCFTGVMVFRTMMRQFCITPADLG